MAQLYAVVCLLLVTSTAALTPAQFALKSSYKVALDKDLFFKWEYGGAIIVDALYSFKDTFDLPVDYTPLLDTYLNNFKTDPKSNPYGYKLLNNEHISFDTAVGDGIGLFPINYLTRAAKYPQSNETDTDWRVVNKVVQDYIRGWPLRLPDGTFSRHAHASWTGETDRNASFLWADDMFMGLTLVSRLAVVKRDSDLAHFAARQAIQFAQHMMDEDDFLIYHGYNDADQKVSCCKWGRANGWAMMSHIEVLEALSAVNDTYSPLLREIMAGILYIHTKAIIKTQSQDGRWHQVLTANSTFLETSATAMFVSSMARGVLRGWLKFSPEVDASIRRGWQGLQSTLQPDGTVTGICAGTGIFTAVDDYEKRPTLYVLSSPGLGSVLYAARDMQLYMEKYGEK